MLGIQNSYSGQALHLIDYQKLQMEIDLKSATHSGSKVTSIIAWYFKDHWCNPLSEN